MGTPKEQEFLESMEALAEPLPHSLLSQFSNSMMLSDNRQSAIGLIKDIAQWDTEQLTRALKTTAAKWLKNDPMISRAYEAARKRVPGIGSDEIIEYLYKDIRSGVAFRQPEALETDLRWVQVQSAKDSYYTFTRGWVLALLRAFHEYHFQVDIVRQSVLAEKQLMALRQLAISGAEALRDLERQGIGGRRRLHTSLHQSSSDLVEYHFESQLRRINRFYENAQRLIQPIKRNDSTSKERLLVYRLWEAHSAIFRHHKPRAIQIILLTEGIKNQIDERSVEKMCAGFKADRKQPGHINFIRNLFDDIRGEKYRNEIHTIYAASLREELAAQIGPQVPLAARQ